MAKTPEKETQKARSACEQYLLMGPERSLAKLAKAMGKKDSYVVLLERWSKAHSWQEKARAYDQAQFDKRRRDHQARIDQMNEEHYMLARVQSLRAVKLIDKRIENEKLIDVALVQYIKAMVDLQRLAAGAATEQLALTGKDGGPIETDVVVETFWGRGTDPRRKAPEITKEVEADDEEDTALTAEIDDDDEDAWEADEESWQDEE